MREPTPPIFPHLLYDLRFILTLAFMLSVLVGLVLMQAMLQEPGHDPATPVVSGMRTTIHLGEGFCLGARAVLQRLPAENTPPRVVECFAWSKDTFPSGCGSYLENYDEVQVTLWGPCDARP